MKYRVLIRKEIIAETWINVEAGGYVQAQQKAIDIAKEKDVMWLNTGVLNRVPYAVTFEKGWENGPT